jgi:hypothetical protein
MGIQEELAEAIAIVNGLPSTRRGGAFVADVERFVAYLGAMPDNRAFDITESRGGVRAPRGRPNRGLHRETYRARRGPVIRPAEAGVEHLRRPAQYGAGRTVVSSLSR